MMDIVELFFLFIAGAVGIPIVALAICCEIDTRRTRGRRTGEKYGF